MGSIHNGTADGDPINEVNLAGFNALPDALEYVSNGFRGGNPIFSHEVQRGKTVGFTGTPMAVFWEVTPEGQLRLLSVTQIFGDLNLIAGSIGSQFLVRFNGPA